jgi:hypothetical protein
MCPNDGSQCTLREMDTTFIGSGYGDERYEYNSNPNNYTIDLEWSDKKGCWGKVTYSVEIVKSLVKQIRQDAWMGMGR